MSDELCDLKRLFYAMAVGGNHLASALNSAGIDPHAYASAEIAAASMLPVFSEVWNAWAVGWTACRLADARFGADWLDDGAEWFRTQDWDALRRAEHEKLRAAIR